MAAPVPPQRHPEPPAAGRVRPGYVVPPAPVALLGRDAELAQLVEAFHGDRWVAVVGEAGIGKTSLVRAGLAASSRHAFEGGGFATLAWMPYLALSRAVGRTVAGDASQAAAVVERAVGPGILFVDDLQWVDAPSRAALERLAGRVMVVAAVREGDPDAAEAIALLDRANAETVPLASLAAAEAEAIVRRIRPDASPTAVAEAVRRGAGNPLLLEEIGRTGASSGVLGRTLEARRGRLTSRARASLDLLAIAGRPLPRTGVPGIDKLIRAGLAVSREDLVEIRHALLGESIRASLDDVERRAAHEAAADLVNDPAERARHLLEAGRPSVAADVAGAALPDAPDHPGRAALLVVLAEATGDPAHRLAAARALSALGAHEEVLAIVRDVLDDGSEISNEALVLRARATYRTGRADEGWALVQALQARQTDPSTPAAARLASEVGQMLINLRGDPPAALAYLTGQLGHHVRDGPGWMRIATLRETVRLYAGQRPDLELLERGADSALAEGDLDAPGRVSNVYKARLAFGGARPALDFLLDRIGRLHTIGMGSPAHDLRAEAAQAAIYAGDFRAAVALADFVLERPASFRARHQAAVRRADALTYLGDFDLARASVELAAGAMHGDLADKGERLMTEAEMAYWSGATERAVELADELTKLGAGSLANLALPLLTGAWADLDLGRPIRDVPLVDFPALAGLPFEVGGINHLATGAFEDASTQFDQAAEGWAGYITPRELVCRWATGESLRRAGDTAEAVERLQVALGRAEKIGFEPLAARARRSLRMAGVRVSASPRGSAGDGIALSRRETELVRLVDQGLSNIEIARRLGLGRPTVARMMASAMGKLGVDRRAQLAARELV